MEKVFTESELRALSDALGDTDDGLRNSEIGELLQYVRAQDEADAANKRQRIFIALWNQQARLGHRRNALEFVRQAMQPARYLRNPERFEKMRANLNRALSFAGLQVDAAGTLGAAERVSTIPEAEGRARELMSDLALREVHPEVLRFCRAELLADNYFHAVQEATKSVFERLRTMTGCPGDGRPWWTRSSAVLIHG